MCKISFRIKKLVSTLLYKMEWMFLSSQKLFKDFIKNV